MKNSLLVALLSLVFVYNTAHAQSKKDSIIQQEIQIKEIRKEFQRIEQSKNLEIVTAYYRPEFINDTKDYTAYFDRGRLVKLRVWSVYKARTSTVLYYLKDDQLFFVFEILQDDFKGEKREERTYLYKDTIIEAFLKKASSEILEMGQVENLPRPYLYRNQGAAQSLLNDLQMHKNQFDSARG